MYLCNKAAPYCESTALFGWDKSMKHRASFAFFNVLSDSVIEVIVDEGIEMTLEMVEEYHDFIVNNMPGDFGLLINRINRYSYSYEAQLSVSSSENMKAIAFIYYDEETKLSSMALNKIRMNDGWNLKLFSGLELGRETALNWLNSELTTK